MSMCITCEKSKHNFHFARVQRHLRAYVHRATDVTKLGPAARGISLTVPAGTAASLRGNSSTTCKHALQVCRTSVLELPLVSVSVWGHVARSSVAPSHRVVTPRRLYSLHPPAHAEVSMEAVRV